MCEGREERGAAAERESASVDVPDGAVEAEVDGAAAAGGRGARQVGCDCRGETKAKGCCCGQDAGQDNKSEVALLAGGI